MRAEPHHISLKVPTPAKVPESALAKLGMVWKSTQKSHSGFILGKINSPFQVVSTALSEGHPSGVVQVAAAYTKSALNKTAAFPQLTINGLVHYSDPLDSNSQPQAGTQDVNFLYSLAWIDLTGGPLVLTVPASSGRFYELEFVDAYNGVPLLIGAYSLPIPAREIYRFPLVTLQGWARKVSAFQ